MNAAEKIVDLVAVILLLFLLPLLYYGSARQSTEVVMAGQAGTNFLKRIGTSGKITVPVWNELETALKKYGDVTFDLQRERYLYEPLGKSGEVYRQSYCIDKAEIEKQLRETGSCYLQKGDRMKLILYVNEIPTVYYNHVRTGAMPE